MFHIAEFRYVTDLQGSWQTYEGFFAPVNWQLESGDSFIFAVIPAGDRPDEPFEIAEDVIILPGPYRWYQYGMAIESAAKRKLAGEFSYLSGDFYDGTLSSSI